MKKKKKEAGGPVPAARSTTRRKLIDAAHELIWANSYAHVSVDDICRAAGVQKGSFYHFFPTKIDLAATALEDYWGQVKPELDEIFAAHLSPRQQLQALCRAIEDEQKESLARTGRVCGCPYASIAAEMAGSHEGLHSLSQEMSERFSACFEQLLRHAARAGLSPSTGITQRARQMHVYVLGAMFEARITNTLTSVGPSLAHALLRISGMDAADKPATAKHRASAVRKKPVR